MQKLYKFELDCGRMGDLEGVFVADSDEIDFLIGEKIYFGEVLGKHSEIYCNLSQDMLTVLTDDPQVVSIFAEHVGRVGYNPVDYFESYHEALVSEIISGEAVRL